LPRSFDQGFLAVGLDEGGAFFGHGDGVFLGGFVASAGEAEQAARRRR
jgi:hypothetical protein